MVGGNVFIIDMREVENSQRHLKGLRLNMVSRIDWAVRGEDRGRTGREEEKREGQDRGQGEGEEPGETKKTCGQMDGLHRRERNLGKGT